MNLHYYDLIKKPILTEKSNFLAEQNKFLFEVSKTANKRTIKSAIEKIFEVEVLAVNLLNMKGKIKKFKGRTGKLQDVKKAIVTLAKNHTIDLTGGGK